MTSTRRALVIVAAVCGGGLVVMVAFVALLVAVSTTVVRADEGRAAGVPSSAAASAASTPTITPSPSAASPSAPGASTPTPTMPTPSASTAQQVVVLLVVKGRGPATGYDRALFGWNSVDLDRNGCDQRNDTLRRDLVDTVIAPGSNGCRVESGVLNDRYTQTAIRLPRERIEIDHVVSLSNAWQHGAAGWSREQRLRFAHDPLNLVATTSELNQRKGAGDAATWLPPATTYRCDYVARQAAVKHRYGLSVTDAERGAMERVLAGCPGRTLPTGAEPAPRMAVTATPSPAATPPPTPSAPVTTSRPSPTAPTAPPTRRVAPAPGTASPSRAPSTTRSPTPTEPTSEAPQRSEADTDPQFSSCKKAIAAGYGPYRSGIDPEYDWYRDADGDGIVCE